MLPYLLKRAGPYPEFTTNRTPHERIAKSRVLAEWRGASVQG